MKKLNPVSRISKAELIFLPGITIEGEFTVVSEGQPSTQTPVKPVDEQLLYYEPDGKGGMRFVYPDKPSGKSWKL